MGAAVHPSRYAVYSTRSRKPSPAWKGSPELEERMTRVRAYVDKLAPTELEVVARADGRA